MHRRPDAALPNPLSAEPVEVDINPHASDRWYSRNVSAVSLLEAVQCNESREVDTPWRHMLARGARQHVSFTGQIADIGLLRVRRI